MEAPRSSPICLSGKTHQNGPQIHYSGQGCHISYIWPVPKCNNWGQKFPQTQLHIKSDLYWVVTLAKNFCKLGFHLKRLEVRKTRPQICHLWTRFSPLEVSNTLFFGQTSRGASGGLLGRLVACQLFWLAQVFTSSNKKVVVLLIETPGTVKPQLIIG